MLLLTGTENNGGAALAEIDGLGQLIPDIRVGNVAFEYQALVFGADAGLLVYHEYTSVRISIDDRDGFDVIGRMRMEFFKHRLADLPKPAITTVSREAVIAKCSIR